MSSNFVYSLKEFREINKMTQKDAALFFSVNQSFISQIETGKCPMPQSFLDIIKKSDKLIPNTLPAEPAQENLVRVLPIAAHGGMLTNFDIDGIEGVKCETIISPIAGAELAISVTGSSMEPSYPNGSRVLIKGINHNAYIAWGEVYVIDTCNGTLLKELQPGKSEEYIRCVSHNPDERYKPFDVPLSEVRKIYKVLACITLR